MVSSTGAPLVAIAGLSVRLFAQSARRAGWRVAALDCFGDRDTRAAASCWFDVGGANLSIDRGRLVDALGRLARVPKLLGWIGVGGVEPLAAELAGAGGLPPFIGNTPAAAAAVRQPQRFFALLDELGIAHPPVSASAPATPEGWLYKRADGCGGVHVREAAQALASGAASSAPGAGYFQQRRPGRAMSALFVAARGEARVLGFAEQTSCSYGDMPFIHTGALGPVELPPASAARIADALGALAARTGLAGINSFDFLLREDGAFELLEVNARPSSTLAVYEHAWPLAWPRGLVACHVDACLRGVLPAPGPRPADARRRVAHEVLFSPAAFTVDAAFSDACLNDAGCADVPMPGTRIATGDPLVTLVAHAPEFAALRPALGRQRERVLQRLSSCLEPAHVRAP